MQGNRRRKDGCPDGHDFHLKSQGAKAVSALPLIHPSSVIEPGAEVDPTVKIGPFCYVEAGAVIGPDCTLDSHVTIKHRTVIGSHNWFGQGSVIGGDPQDRKYKGEPTFLKIGNNNVFREYVTIHRATGEGRSTVVGNDCYIMAYCHLGHNVTMHDLVTMANSTGVAGHVTIEERANIGGMVGIHQFARIGTAAMVGGFTKITRDVPPFVIVDGMEEEVKDINAVGLRRLGVNAEERLALHKAVKIIYKSRLNLTNALETVRREVPITREVDMLLRFEERRFQGKNGRGDQP
ncbi:MAG: acyl-ACP--UDP-N-acetylglucosamine O-acyltransferase [Armatimonadetes bacterium]|nr:acyl-ACP--UDP-N-acetylglucosamine O-acyltransferase [Armatimonadota bacterium]